MTGRSDSCGALRTELVALLYGELEGAERHRLERHLLGCAPCRQRFEELRATQAELSLWEGPTLSFLEQGEDPGRLAAEVVRQAARTPPPRPTPVGRTARPLATLAVRAAAAAAALLVALSLLGARAELRGGTLDLSFRLPGLTGGAGDAGEGLDVLTPELRRIAAEEAAQELAAQNESLRLEVAELLATFAEREEDRRRELGAWLERNRSEDQQTLLELADLVDTSRRESRLENHQSREAIVELARVLLPNDPTPLETER